MSGRDEDERAEHLFREHRDGVFKRTDRMFAVLMVAQWAFAIVVALTLSPYAWDGKTRSIHEHVWVAVLLGGAISSLPVILALTRPASALTRHVIAVAQMLWSALIIHLTGGRIEAHFHVFGSLAFLALYRDWRVFLPATAVVAADHLIRQEVWPESVYGILSPEWWRFLEHAFWVAFEDIVLIMSCVVATREMRDIARSRATIEALSAAERQRNEKLVAVGQLAASVGHELRNPLAAVRNANSFIAKQLKTGKDLTGDTRVKQFVELIDRELAVCTRIVGDLLDFARERAPILNPCSVRAIAEEAIALLPAHNATVVNEVPAELPILLADKDQLRQVIANLVQNAVEAFPNGNQGRVVIGAAGGGADPWRITVADDGAGIPADARERIFEPLFTTKTKGTGLGLAIVANVVKRHNGSIQVDSDVGRGTTIAITFPPELASREVA
jgi:signal transduction histidine kinase